MVREPRVLPSLTGYGPSTSTDRDDKTKQHLILIPVGGLLGINRQQLSERRCVLELPGAWCRRLRETSEGRGLW